MTDFNFDLNSKVVHRVFTKFLLPYIFESNFKIFIDF
jgi:hypothetical protein